MKQWLIPAVVLIAVGLTGIGVGWSVNEWQDGDGATPAETSAQSEPSQAELDAQRCGAALEAAGNVAPSGGTSRLGPRIVIPDEIKQAIDRYCR